MAEFRSHLYHLGAVWHWGQLLNISVSQFLHLSKGCYNNTACFIGWSWGLHELVHALYLELLMLCITLFAVLPFFFTTSIPPFRSLSPFCLLLCGLVWSGLTTAAAALSQQVAVTGIASARATGVAAPVPPSQPLFSTPVLHSQLYLWLCPSQKPHQQKIPGKSKQATLHFKKHAMSDELKRKGETLALRIINETEEGSREKMQTITFIL